jgi:NAD(P)-dependent dehydrogenase (short-subunit alcohol dehydrogenase family)
MPPKRLLLIGASRGPGFALAEEYLRRGWLVVATERGRDETKLHELASRSERRLEIENVDIVRPDQVGALRARLADRRFDLPMDAQTGKGGLQYLDYLGRQVPW